MFNSVAAPAKRFNDIKQTDLLIYANLSKYMRAYEYKLAAVLMWRVGTGSIPDRHSANILQKYSTEMSAEKLLTLLVYGPREIIIVNRLFQVYWNHMLYTRHCNSTVSEMPCHLKK